MSGVQLQALSILFTVWANVTLTGVALYLGVRRTGHPGLRMWIRALLLQSLGWAALIAAPLAGGARPLVSTLGVVALSLAFGLGWRALGTYLRRPVSWHWVVLAPVVVGAVNFLAYGQVQLRVCTVNLVLAAQLAVLAGMALRRGAEGRRWRVMLAVAALASATMLLVRAVLMAGWPEAYPSFGANHPLSIAGLIIDNATVSIATLAFLLAHRDEAEAQLKQLATQDDLTGLLNRRALLEQGERLMLLGRRHGTALTVMMIDIDHFKRINDAHGHPIGDRVIAHFAAALHSTLREGDVVGRYGGEEFLAVLFDGGPDTARAVDRRLREWMASEGRAALGFPVDFSAGAVTVRGPDLVLESAIAQADEALYRAKQGGRGRLVLADQR